MVRRKNAEPIDWPCEGPALDDFVACDARPRRRAVPRPALAPRGRPLRGARLGDHASADPGGARRPLLGAVPVGVSHGGCPGGRRCARCARAVAGPRLQPSRPGAQAHGRQVRRRGGRSASGDLRRAAGAARHRSGYGGGGGGLRLSAAGRLSGDQRALGVLARALSRRGGRKRQGASAPGRGRRFPPGCRSRPAPLVLRPARLRRASEGHGAEPLPAQRRPQPPVGLRRLPPPEAGLDHPPRARRSRGRLPRGRARRPERGRGSLPVVPRWIRRSSIPSSPTSSPRASSARKTIR